MTRELLEQWRSEMGDGMPRLLLTQIYTIYCG